MDTCHTGNSPWTDNGIEGKVHNDRTGGRGSQGRDNQPRGFDVFSHADVCGLGSSSTMEKTNDSPL